LGKYENIATLYTDTYSRLDFREKVPYDIGIHAIQTALYLQDYNNKTDININDLVFGYYDVNTQKMIKKFQIINKMKPAEGVLNEQTWNAIFDGLALTKGVELDKTGEKEVTIVDSDNFLDRNYLVNLDPEQKNKDYDNDGNDNNPNSAGGINFNNDGNYTLSDDLNGEKYGEDLHNYITDIRNIRGGDIIDGYVTGNGGYVYSGPDEYVRDGSISSIDPGDYNLLGKKIVVMGSDSLTDGNNRWNDSSISSLNDNDYQRDYDFIYNLLANTAYSGGGYINPFQESNSTIDTLENYSGSYERSNNKPFFSPDNMSSLRRSKFDMTIVYGAKGKKARKLIKVVPMSVTQEMNASGEPIYDVYEFVARDVVYSEDD
jgi:hypothetical protein